MFHGSIIIIQEGKCERELEMKVSAAILADLLIFLHVTLTSLCKCHAKFFIHADAACSAATH